MLAYVLRKLAYGGLTVLGVLLLIFVIFFAMARPDDVARRALGENAQAAQIEKWKAKHAYDKPLWPTLAKPGGSLLQAHYVSLLSFEFGNSDLNDSPIGTTIRDDMGASLALTIPMFLSGLVLGLVLALFVAFFRETYIDTMGVFLCVLGMSVSILIYIIGSQFVFAKMLRWFPISGFDTDVIADGNWNLLLRFLALPVTVGVLSSFGGDTRFYRTVFVEEVNRDYVRTARAKGAGEMRVMLRHVLRNAMIPILTRVVVAIPFLFTGSLLLEAFFGIPGLGSIPVDAIAGNDFSVLRVMVYIFALLFILAQIATDISYTLVDPRVRLE